MHSPKFPTYILSGALLLAMMLAVHFVSATPHPKYTDFAQPLASYTLSNRNISFEDTSQTRGITISSSDNAVYRYAYISIGGGAWIPANLSGSTFDDVWLNGSVTTQLTFRASNFSLSTPGTSASRNFIVAYSCSRNATGWDCHSGWQIWQFNASLAGGGTSNATMYLVQNGVARADIVVSPTAPNTIQVAAEYLQYYVNQMTGVQLSISNSPSGSLPYHVYVGRSSYTDALGVTSSGCNNGGFKMVSGSNYIVLLGDDRILRVPGFNGVPGPQSYAQWDSLTGHQWANDYLDYYGNSYNYQYEIWEADAKGSINAVYEFLYDQGIRWYHPGWYEYENLGVVIPSKQSITFGDMNKMVNPDFPMRNFVLYGKQYGELGPYHYDTHYEEEMKWRLSLRTNSFYEFSLGFLGGPGHGIGAVITRQAQTHPEYYALVGGERQTDADYPNPDLCYPYYTPENGLFEENVLYAKAVFDVYNVSTISVMPNDGFTSISDECQDKATPERGPMGVFSDYVWEYTNNVAWEIYNDPAYAGKKISNIAYTTYLFPPVHLSQPIAPNLVVGIARWRSDFEDEQTNELYQNITTMWVDALASNNYLTGGAETNQLFTYDYYMHNADYRNTRSIPYYFPHIASEDLQFLKGKSSGELIEITPLATWPPYEFTTQQWNLEWDAFASESLNTYIAARLYWDAGQDVDALLDEYYTLYYGPVSQQMKAFVEYAEAHYGEATEDLTVIPTLRSMLADARAAAGDTIYGHRIELLIGMMNSQTAGEEVTIDSCQTLDSPVTTYKLTRDVSTPDTCFIITNGGITLDCQGHTITYGTGGGGNRFGVYTPYTEGIPSISVKNCVIQSSGPADYREGIQFSRTSGATFVNNTINVPGTGIWLIDSTNIHVTGNVITSNEGAAFFMQAVTGGDITDNRFLSVSGQGTYLYDTHNVLMTGTNSSSSSSYGLNLLLCTNNTFTNNRFTSTTGEGLLQYESSGNTFLNNIIQP